MSNLKGPTILAVDDTAENLDVIKTILGDSYQLRFARSGKSAIKIAQSKKPDLILLDVSMPEMDGYEVCEVLKSDETTSDIPVIFVTARTNVDDETKGLAYGAVDYITKPLNPSIVQARVRNQLATKQAHDMLKSQIIRMERLNNLAEKTGISLKLEEVHQLICRELGDIFATQEAIWWEIDQARNYLVPQKCSYQNDPTALFTPLSLADSSLDRLLTAKAPFITSAEYNAREAAAINASLGLKDSHQSLVIPVVQAGMVSAILIMPFLDEVQIFQEQEMVMAKTIALQVASTLDNAALYNKVQNALGAVQNDLDIGREIQASFFPETTPQIAGWELSTYFSPAREVSGDFYDTFTTSSDGYVVFVVSDVCDKGVGSALYMATTRSLLRSLCQREIIGQNPAAELQTIISMANEYLYINHGKSNMFATTVVGLLSTEDNTVYYANAGHEAPVLMGVNGSVKQLLEPGGPALGLMGGVKFDVGSVIFEPGDMLFSYTDGVTDARNKNNDVFGEERMMGLLLQPSPSAHSLVYKIEQTLEAYSNGIGHFDDITIMILRRRLTPGDEVHQFTTFARIENLRPMIGFVEKTANIMNLGKETLFAYKLASDEAINNIIDHGYTGRDDGTIELTFERTKDGTRLTLKDFGAPFDPKTIKAPDLELDWDKRPVGRLGMHLVNTMIDSVTYKGDTTNGNELVLEMTGDRQITEQGDI